MLYLKGYKRHSSKYALYLKKVKFLGHVLSANSVAIQTSKIDTVRD